MLVIDAQGCRNNASSFIAEPNALVFQAAVVNPNCNDPSSGGISLNIQGGASPYTILWSDGNTNLARNNLSAGFYEAMITDANGCQEPYSVVLDGATGPVITSIDVDSSGCIGSNSGQIEILGVTGGTPLHVFY